MGGNVEGGGGITETGGGGGGVEHGDIEHKIITLIYISYDNNTTTIINCRLLAE